MNKALALIGGGGHARSVIAALPGKGNLSGYVDIRPRDDMALFQSGLKWLGDDDCFLSKESPDRFEILITLVSGRDCSLDLRRKLIERYAAFSSPVVIAPTSWVGEGTDLGKGTVVLNHAVVNVNSSVGEHSVVNTGAIVEHDCKIGSNVFIGPGVVVCGGVEIGNNVYVGAGAVIRPGLRIADGSLVSLGASVFHNIVKPGTYLGNPARKIK